MKRGETRADTQTHTHIYTHTTFWDGHGMLVDSLLWRGFKASGCPRKLNFYGQSNSSHVSALWITVVPRKGWNVGRSIRERLASVSSLLKTLEEKFFLNPRPSAFWGFSSSSSSSFFFALFDHVRCHARFFALWCPWSLPRYVNEIFSLSLADFVYFDAFLGNCRWYLGAFHDVDAWEILWTSILEDSRENRLIIFCN